MENTSLKYLINIIFKILGLYEKINDKDNTNFTKENYIVYLEKTLVDINGYIDIFKEDEKIYGILYQCYLSTIGILKLVKEGQDDHKIIRSKVLDMTNNISRCMTEGD